MFRTDFNQWLQSFESDWLTGLMKAVSSLGAIYPIMIISLVVIAGFHFRKGWILLNIVAYTSIFTVFLKETIDYPRPLAVDTQLEAFGSEQTIQDLTSIQPTTTFELFSSELLSITRGKDLARHGLPSGHTSIQIALWIGLAVLFRKKWLWVVSITFVILTMWSRMYLAMHYPGDIIGGTIVGFATLGAVYFLSRLLDQDIRKKVLFSLLPIITLLAFNSSDNWQSGLLLGANIGILLSFRQSDYELSSGIGIRLMSSLSLIIIFLSFFIGMKLIARSVSDVWEAELMMLAGFGSVTLYLLLAKKFRWLLAIS